MDKINENIEKITENEEKNWNESTCKCSRR